uniref:DUF3105 domain-containing protein n=1 Tax=Strigamia maritima TaxID=126957 RepID=T1J6D3_STRMM
MRLVVILSYICFVLSFLNVWARVEMGRPDSDCDDAKTNLTVDWDESPVNYTCYTKFRLKQNRNLKPSLECDDIPIGYIPEHYCMDKSIHYPTPLPTHAGHRPLWPKYGEYLFVPPQRWSHNIEHGAVVMLTHPCAHPKSVEKLKKIVKSCMWKHIISTSNQVPVDRPLVLIAWGCRLRMSYIDEKLVKNFIQTYALHGPEGKYTKEGQYTLGLTTPASIPFGSTRDDSNLCP